MCWCDPQKRTPWCDNCHTVRPDLANQSWETAFRRYASSLPATFREPCWSTEATLSCSKHNYEYPCPVPALKSLLLSAKGEKMDEQKKETLRDTRELSPEIKAKWPGSHPGTTNEEVRRFIDAGRDFDDNTALRMIWRAVAGEQTSAWEQEAFDDWKSNVSTAEIFEKIYEFAHSAVESEPSSVNDTPKQCRWCGTEFSPKEVPERFCSQECAVKAAGINLGLPPDVIVERRDASSWSPAEWAIYDKAYNAGLEKAASWISGYAESPSAYDTQTFAKNMADSIRAQMIKEQGPKTCVVLSTDQLANTQAALKQLYDAVRRSESVNNRLEMIGAMDEAGRWF